jgi:hypothetical protein
LRRNNTKKVVAGNIDLFFKRKRRSLEGWGNDRG